MPVHVEYVDCLAHYELRVFKPSAQYGDRYCASLTVVIRAEYLEIRLLEGDLTRQQIREGLSALRNLSKEHKLPVMAQRKEGVLPGFERLCGDWWVLDLL